MKRDISAQAFDKLSNEAKKKYVVSLLIKEAGADSVIGAPPIAVVMAGVPGSGKTEFLDSFSEEISNTKKYNQFVRIDLDQIVTIYPDYTPKTYAKFRSRGNNILARCIDVLRDGKYNMMIDGTFSGSSGASVRNVEKLLSAGYIVLMFYMYDTAESAWRYTQLREIETDRGIDRKGFEQSCNNVSVNLIEVTDRFRNNPKFSLSVVRQKELRDKNYDILTKQEDVDKIIAQGYNIDNIKEL